jgi:hypothetical protein
MGVYTGILGLDRELEIPSLNRPRDRKFHEVVRVAKGRVGSIGLLLACFCVLCATCVEGVPGARPHSDRRRRQTTPEPSTRRRRRRRRTTDEQALLKFETQRPLKI